MATYPLFNELHAEQILHRMSGARSLIFAVRLDEEPVVYKRYERAGASARLESVLRRMEIPVKNYLMHSAQFYRRSQYQSPTQLQQMEAATLRAWNVAGIPSPRILDYQPGTMVMTYEPGTTQAVIVEDATPRPREFGTLLETFAAIRQLARRRRDPQLIHPDTHLENFHYDGRRTVALDPSLDVDQTAPFEEVDTSSLLFLLHNVMSRHGPHAEEYGRMLWESLDTPTRLKLADQFHRPDAKARLFAEARSLGGRLYRRERFWTSADLLKPHVFDRIAHLIE